MLSMVGCAQKPINASVCFINYRNLMAICGTTVIDKNAVSEMKENDVLLVVTDGGLVKIPLNDLLDQ